MFHTPTNAAFTILFANFETTFTLFVSCIFKSAIYRRPYGGGCRGTMYIFEQLEKWYVGPFRGPPIAPSPTLYSVHYLHTTIPACHTTSVCTRLGRWWYAGPFRGPTPSPTLPLLYNTSIHAQAPTTPILLTFLCILYGPGWGNPGLGRWWYAGPFRGPIPPATSASSVHCSALPTCTSPIPVATPLLQTLRHSLQVAVGSEVLLCLQPL